MNKDGISSLRIMHMSIETSINSMEIVLVAIFSF